MAEHREASLERERWITGKEIDRIVSTPTPFNPTVETNNSIDDVGQVHISISQGSKDYNFDPEIRFQEMTCGNSVFDSEYNGDSIIIKMPATPPNQILYAPI